MNCKQPDPTLVKLSQDLQTIKTLVEKQPTPDDILEKITQLTQNQKAPLEAALKDIHSKVEPLHQASRDVPTLFSSSNIDFFSFQSIEMKKNNEDISKKIDQLINPLQNINEKIEQIYSKKPQDSSTDLNNTLKKLDHQLTDLNKNLPAMDDLSKQIGREDFCSIRSTVFILDSLKETLEKLQDKDQRELSSPTMKETSDRSKTLDETTKGLSKSRSLIPSNEDDEKNHTDNLRQVPRSQSGIQSSNQLTTTPTSDQQTANLLTNLLTLQTTIQNSDSIPSEDIQPYLKRIEQSPSVRTDPDLQKVFLHSSTSSKRVSHSSYYNVSMISV